jgi:ABC-type polysaccharide/polyol phosphate export permease
MKINELTKQQILGSRELLWNLSLRELRTKYRRSALGWTWSLLNPLATVAIFTFVFGHVFQSQAPVGDPSGINIFALFLLCGLLPWNFFTLVTGQSMGSLLGNAGLVKKVSFQRETLVLSQVIFAFVQFSIEMSILFVAITVAGSGAWKYLPMVLLLMVILAMFATGISLALAAVAVYFHDLNYLWTIFCQLWFFATPIVYAPTVLTGRVPGFVEKALKLNPMSGYVRSFRVMLYDGVMPGVKTMAALLALSLASIAFGLWVFRRLSARMPEEL